MNKEDYRGNLQLELQAWDRSRQTLATYDCAVGQYLATVPEEEVFTRQGINRFMVKLDREGKSQNTKRLKYYALKRFFEVNNQPWPFHRAAPRKAKPTELKAPKMPSEDVRRLIERSLSCLEPWEVGIVALSTTYGLRREEIHQLRGEDIGDKIFIRTVKGGVETEHILPPEVAPHIRNWAELPEARRPALSTLSALYHSILARCGVEDSERGGFHTIRRRLATDLREAGVDVGVIYQFLRWQLPTVMGI